MHLLIALMRPFVKSTFQSAKFMIEKGFSTMLSICVGEGCELSDEGAAMRIAKKQMRDSKSQCGVRKASTVVDVLRKFSM